jgi:signal transduction histidine kinase
MVRFRIKDNGVGIPGELLDKLGEKGASFRDGDRRGSGLGLYHAKANIEAWGGKLTIQSVVGEGTEIAIALPVDE